ncbi:CYTH domain-containing protein [Rossellomorea marisflavi]|uniref:CYTH domain-containing protein n=1 Tax=Rossellomorea marisflavi TaxID=189381 RepID=UPI0020795F28|nr:CYTH domain-containing protein [Rossellomorea marisflavi]USK93816.1 CYTH domain-containing protein [Rossellomorea marisflavi]
MPKEIEIEFKNILTIDEFAKLSSALNVKEADFLLQTNHYFDTEDFKLKETRSALRIRSKSGHHTLTLKTPHGEDLLETNQPLSEEEAASLLKDRRFPEGEVRDTILGLNIDPAALQHFGTLHTKRSEQRFKGGLLVLDQSEYLDKEDYELEYEAAGRIEGEAIFLELLETFQIPVRPTKNKVRRFYEELKKKQQEKSSQ